MLDNPFQLQLQQTTGQSTTSTMSQKAITDELDDLARDITSIEEIIIDGGSGGGANPQVIDMQPGEYLSDIIQSITDATIDKQYTINFYNHSKTMNWDTFTAKVHVPRFIHINFVGVIDWWPNEYYLGMQFEEGLTDNNPTDKLFIGFSFDRTNDNDNTHKSGLTNNLANVFFGGLDSSRQIAYSNEILVSNPNDYGFGTLSLVLYFGDENGDFRDKILFRKTNSTFIDVTPNFKYCDFSGNYMIGVYLGCANLEYASFQGANLFKSNLEYANLYSANLENANLENANLIYTNLNYANLIKANLGEIKASYGTSFKYADFSYANLERALFEYCYFQNAYFEYTNFKSSTFYHANFESAELNDCNFENANMSQANFMNTYIYGCNFKNAYLSGAVIQNSDLEGSNFEEAGLWNVNMQFSILKNCNLTNAFLTNSNLTNADLTNADLTNADLQVSNFTNADLTNADLTNARLLGSNFTNATGLDSDISIALSNVFKGPYQGYGSWTITWIDGNTYRCTDGIFTLGF